MKRVRNALLATSAMALLAACASDGAGTAGGGNAGPLASVPQIGVTGSGGATEATGLAALTDPILGTDGVLGGGSDGLVGGQVPADQLTPLSSQLQPVADQVAGALPLDMVTGQIPALGVNGSDGLVSDLTGQDLLTPIVGTTGILGGTLAGGDSGAIGNIVPAGTIPSLPVDGLPGLPALPGVPGGSGGDPLAPVTDAVATVTSTLGGATGGGSGPLAPVTGVLDTVTGALP
ncbi:MAG: hypothetical protein WBG82_11730 [Parvibaculum sp.]|uniref:hypothetical protein n=1 Tax=Parvibaculum sp. TaxID=2024848 RepID=UPI003C72D4F0